MFTKKEKSDIKDRLKGVKGIGNVFNMINQGASREEVYAEVQRLEGERDNNVKLSLLRDEGESPPTLSAIGKHMISGNAFSDAEALLKLKHIEQIVLMPDAHRIREGNAPNGSVIKSSHIWPGFVGEDIACSVHLTKWVYDYEGYKPEYSNYRTFDSPMILKTNTFFGNEILPSGWQGSHRFFRNDGYPSGMTEYGVIEKDGSHDTLAGVLKTVEGRDIFRRCLSAAELQFGTSGDGNHFVNVGRMEDGKTAILSHFGSRNVGAMIAREFNKIAMSRYDMPKGLNAAPLERGSDHEHDYILLMNWAQVFAEKGHEFIHRQIVSIDPDKMAEEIHTTHNFAEYVNGSWVHRKGATPANRGEISIIPTTMGHGAYVVMGLGNEETLNSATHGCGRVSSRGNAKTMNKGIEDSLHETLLKEYGVKLIGGDTDEYPNAYKNHIKVMDSQRNCVRIIGEFKNKIVRMAEPRIPHRGKRG